MPPETTPMMQQYLKMKEENKDAILFFRLGDFTRCPTRTPCWPARSWT